MRSLHSILRFSLAALTLGASALSHAASIADSVDALVASSAERLTIAEQVALAKWDSKGRVEDPPREAVVIDKAKEAGAARQIDADWVAAFFRAQIEANKEVQYAQLAAWHRAGAAPAHQPVDLAHDIRPRLDMLQTQFIRQLAAAAPLRMAADCNAQVAQAVGNYAIDHNLELDSARVAALDRAMAGFCGAK